MYKKILMPVDIFEMDLSDKAIRHAVYLAGESGEITLLNVLPNSNRSILRGFASDIKKFEDYMQSESAKKMKNLQRLFDMPAERIHTEVRFGNIRDEVLALSKTGEYDVIVIGSRQRGITTHLLGSNAESILRYANIPTMVIR
ncbi:TPA: universal stress protein [Kluyvera georgiana]|uniref:Universal stress protein G n=1 Tax=Kluyvera georgiana ATCC 51603 TaxID=1354264 RepID=A0A1B7JY40_9ENTR|nr:universal stress protein [Kluyvera georgiana]MDA8494972.1 universal stress protein [Kluyvera georgiana]OAT52806.1 universal stress protein G [Kluyvera georgiana ATCC 51603]HDG1691274.1 universal stress protein [Kluyvera georgiana]HED1418687.1 universal stress protein [Kluyvera georgiana]